MHSGVRAQRLCLELTESMLMRDSGCGTDVLGELRALGVGLALDDFGTGYSSLGRLRHLRADRLKIDRSFIADAAEEPIVAAIVGMARGLGLAVTAEGIETREQFERVRSLGCDAAQGFLLARPGPPEEVAGLLSVPLAPLPLASLRRAAGSGRPAAARRSP